MRTGTKRNDAAITVTRDLNTEGIQIIMIIILTFLQLVFSATKNLADYRNPTYRRR